MKEECKVDVYLHVIDCVQRITALEQLVWPITFTGKIAIFSHVEKAPE